MSTTRLPGNSESPPVVSADFANLSLPFVSSAARYLTDETGNNATTDEPCSMRKPPPTLTRLLQIHFPNHCSQGEAHTQARTSKVQRPGTHQPARARQERRLQRRQQEQNPSNFAFQTNSHGPHAVLFVLRDVLVRIYGLENSCPDGAGEVQAEQRRRSRPRAFRTASHEVASDHRRHKGSSLFLHQTNQVGT